MLDSAMMTELDEILSLLVEQVDGALAAAVAGMDGLLVEQFPQDNTEMAGVAAELTNVLVSGRNAISNRLEGGPLRELILGCERRVGYVRVLDDDLFCLIVLGPEGNLGKARLYGAQAAERLKQVLV
jgi:predicted regulator of Ras-like GTPase activity (Roadblock/LC7/MglB family)